MRNLIQTVVAALVIVASVAFTGIGIVRAATGYKWNPKPLSGIAFFSMASSNDVSLTGTPEPTQTAEPSETPEPTHIAGTESHDNNDMDESTGSTAEPTEMDDEDSQSGFSHGQGEDSGQHSSYSHSGEHHSGSGSQPGWNDDDSDGD